MDHHVHAAITAGLRQRGVDVLTASQDGTADLDDELVLGRATTLDRVLFSQDRDFLVLAHQWHQTGKDFAGLVYGHQLALTIGQAITDLHLIAMASDPADMRNRIEFIPF
jgi:hypothetical protein